MSDDATTTSNGEALPRNNSTKHSDNILATSMDIIINNDDNGDEILTSIKPGHDDDAINGDSILEYNNNENDKINCISENQIVEMSGLASADEFDSGDELSMKSNKEVDKEQEAMDVTISSNDNEFSTQEKRKKCHISNGSDTSCTPNIASTSAADTAIDPDSFKEKSKQLISSIEKLQSRIDDVIAFPTLSNFKRLHHQGSAAHWYFVELSRLVEFGNIIDTSNRTSATASSNNIDTDVLKSKLSSLGTNMWLNVQNNPKVFRDYVSNSTHSSSTTAHQSSIIPQDEKRNDELTLEKERAAASGYIRSLACRLVLISKIQTKSLFVPKLVINNSSVSPLPLAMNGELEFAFKCLTRAGKAMMNYSSSSMNSASVNSVPEHFDLSAAYTTLSLALEFWSSLDQVLKMNNDYAKRSVFVDEVFGVMLLLPDCVTALTGVDKKDDLLFEQKMIDKKAKTQSYFDVVTRTIDQLKRLEEFVDKQISSQNDTNKHPNHELKVIQYFLPSLARTSYKHGNRLARLSNYEACQEAIRVSLSSTDKCLAMIKDKIESYDKETSVSNGIKQLCQIQEQEMLVLSKQSFYILSHVYKSIRKIDEAKKCLDRIETYVEDQARKDEKQYKEIMRRFLESEEKENEPFANLSGIMLEGPKKQDIAEIKARATSARKRAKYAEKMERLNLAYCRVMLGYQSAKILDEEERQTDIQFKAMISLAKDLENNNASSSDATLFPSKTGDCFDLVFSAARSIYTRREKAVTKERLGNPYDILFASYDKGDEKHVEVLLEYLNALLVLANELHGVDDTSISKKEKIRSQAIIIGKELLSQIRQKLTTTSWNSGVINSTLFSNKQHNMPKPNLAQTITISREYFTRALSIYYSSRKDYLAAIEWCDLLIGILLISQQFSRQFNADEIPHESCERVVSEIIATKALSLSMTNCHGAALKAAREAYEKCSTEVGNIVTLFHCSVQYESQSVQNDGNICTYENTLFELDNALSNFLSTAKLGPASEETNLNKILESFPVMFNTAIKADQDFGSLLLGLQKRYLDLLVDHFSAMISKGEWNVHDQSISEANIPGNNNIFKVLCSYLVNVQKILSSKHHLEADWITGQFQVLQKTLDNVLKLLIELRDFCIKKRDSLTQFSISFNETLESQVHNELLFQKGNVMTYVGSNDDCLWIAEQLWNIATQIMTQTSDDAVEKCKKRHTVAELYGKAHDFALLSEEECGEALTKGYLDYENFDARHFTAKMIDFASSLNVASTDICSEFSTQCLLLKVAYIIDDLTDRNFSDDHGRNGELTKAEETYLARAMNCLIAAYMEMCVLDVEMNNKIIEQVPWLALSLMIFLQDDEFCSKALSECGLLTQLERILNQAKDEAHLDDKDDIEVIHVKRVFLLATRAEHFGMNESTKLLLSLYAKEAIKYGYNKDDVSITISSIGLIQRKIINLASRVGEVVDVFNGIYEQIKNFTAQEDAVTQKLPYETEDIDYFVVEAHNRAVSLLYVGDFKNAERLLTVALNLIPYSGKEVECYAGDIRNVYRGVIQRCADEGNSNPMSSYNLLDLFK